MVEKVSYILLTMWLVSASILRQGQNITNSFALTGSMDPLAIKHHQMINTSKMIRRGSCDVYNVLHNNYSGGFLTTIPPKNIYTWIDYMEKDRVILIIQCMRTTSIFIWYHT